jgi:hypothetical protein
MVAFCYMAKAGFLVSSELVAGLAHDSPTG